MKKILQYIKYITYSLILIYSVTYVDKSDAESLSTFTEKPIYENPESSIEGFGIDILIDQMIYYYYSLPKEGVKKHNSITFLALGDPSHGKIFSWESGRYYGLVKMVATVKENEKLCRIWIEEVGKIATPDNYGTSTGLVKVTKKIDSNKACFDLSNAKWIIVDEYFHFKNQ
jgi:hypothetical protein|tara:strand:- start:89 stop:604 length:516 start_codon:yes stop_codon:yes gene_type:complete